MLDLLLSEKILNYVLQNPRCTNKFLGFFWRAALVFGGILAVILMLIYLFVGKESAGAVYYDPCGSCSVGRNRDTDCALVYFTMKKADNERRS